MVVMCVTGDDLTLDVICVKFLLFFSLFFSRVQSSS